MANLQGKRGAAHRIAWMLFRGEIPAAMFVCHTCDIPACVNPDHLFLGTPAMNAADARRKGRIRQGERISAAKLTTVQVQQVLALLAEDRMYMTEIARQFGVCVSTISGIRSGRLWRIFPVLGLPENRPRHNPRLFRPKLLKAINRCHRPQLFPAKLREPAG
ncbi:MAG TPA: HNH endonuclease [Candidatus Angelobacter sp.]|nr:HNH endonuclease [Candidatus Angelobacter sp.]